MPKLHDDMPEDPVTPPAFMPFNRPSSKPLISHRSYLMICPVCTRAWTDNRRTCLYCLGTDGLPVSLLYVPVGAVVPESGAWLATCAFCNFRFDRGTEACPSCGRRVVPPKTSEWCDREGL